MASCQPPHSQHQPQSPRPGAPTGRADRGVAVGLGRVRLAVRWTDSGCRRVDSGISGRPGQGTFVQAMLSQVALPELTALRRSLSGWLTAADEAGLDQDGIVALFTSALRDFYERRGGSGARGGAASGGTERVA